MRAAKKLCRDISPIKIISPISFHLYSVETTSEAHLEN